jgi:hypothetical protein
MRTALAALVLCSTLAFAALADDTKPPAITDVKASVKGSTVTVEAKITDETGVLSAICHHRGKGGKIEDSPMTKNDYDDIFKVTFPGGGDSEYWIESSDLLGNGPSTYGSSSKPFAANGKPAKGSTAVAKAEPPPKAEPAPEPAAKPEPVARKERHHREPPPEPAEPRPEHHSRTAKASTNPPVIEHRKPSAQPPENQDFTLRIKIHSEAPIAVAILQSKQQGEAAFTTTPLTHTDEDSYEAKIPGAQAKGTVEYFIAAKDSTGKMARQGDGDSKSPYTVTFRSGSGAALVASSEGAASGPLSFTHWNLTRVSPGAPVVIRAQIVPASGDGAAPEKAMVLWRGNDGEDQATEMVADQTGGFGGLKAQLPAQSEGTLFYQIVACDSGNKCSVDTGSKRKWHGASIASQPGNSTPLPLEAVSSKAPPSLPD